MAPACEVRSVRRRSDGLVIERHRHVPNCTVMTGWRRPASGMREPVVLLLTLWALT